MREEAKLVDSFRACASLVLAAAVFGLAGCQVASLSGPNQVNISETITYTMEYSGFHDVSNLTPVIVAQVPVGWLPVSSSYTGTANGVPVTGAGIVAASDPTGCSLPILPAGYQRIVFTAGPFPAVLSTDTATVALTFRAGGAPGNYTVSFWGEGISNGDHGCQDSPANVEVAVRASVPVPIANGWGLGALTALVLAAGALTLRSRNG
jgi:hypothetical protein